MWLDVEGAEPAELEEAEMPKHSSAAAGWKAMLNRPAEPIGSANPGRAS